MLPSLPLYVTQTEVARVVGLPRRRIARLLASARVTFVPEGRAYAVVSTQRLRLHLPEVYDALLAAGSPPAGA